MSSEPKDRTGEVWEDGDAMFVVLGSPEKLEPWTERRVVEHRVLLISSSATASPHRASATLFVPGETDTWLETQWAPWESIKRSMRRLT